jgi:mono/diheme cytochrome c family protein
MAVRSRRLLIVNGTILTIVLAAVSAQSASPAQSSPDAAQLSFTATQVASGEAEYKVSCIDCHGPNLDDGEFGGPPLKGDAFTAKWFKLPVSALVGYVHAAMPPDAPGRLPLGSYVEIVDYILSVNGMLSGTKEMPADMNALAALRYPPQKNERGK